MPGCSCLPVIEADMSGFVDGVEAAKARLLAHAATSFGDYAAVAECADVLNELLDGGFLRARQVDAECHLRDMARFAAVLGKI